MKYLHTLDSAQADEILRAENTPEEPKMVVTFYKWSIEARAFKEIVLFVDCETYDEAFHMAILHGHNPSNTIRIERI